jgi:alkaline phosphatase
MKSKHTIFTKFCLMFFIFMAALACGASPLIPLNLAIPSDNAAAAAESEKFKILPVGAGSYADANFIIAGVNNDSAPACLALDKGTSFSRTFDNAVEGDVLYLLHAGSNTNKRLKTPAAAIRICGETELEDKTFQLFDGNDIVEWHSENRDGKNAIRAFSRYNGSTQAALFVSKFKLPFKVKSVEFTSLEHRWIIFGASVGKDIPLKKIVPVLSASKNIKPIDFSDVKIPVTAAGKTPSNVILIIGDGMGKGAIEYASRFLYGGKNRLLLDRLPAQGSVTTHSTAAITDSAASATAIACGVKTNNGWLGLDPKGNPLVSISEIARKNGFSAGLLTSEAFWGATPAAFIAKHKNRGASGSVSEQIAAAGYDLIIGNESGKKIMTKAFSNVDSVEIKSPEDIIKASAGAKNIHGSVNMSEIEYFTEYCRSALCFLDSRDTKGFFIMIEMTWNDHGGHRNIPDATVRGVLAVNAATAVALEFAEKNPDTLIIITADHETGKVTPETGENGEELVRYFSSGHSEADVSIYAVGPGSELFNGQMDNTDIHKKIRSLIDPEYKKQ